MRGDTGVMAEPRHLHPGAPRSRRGARTAVALLALLAAVTLVGPAAAEEPPPDGAVLRVAIDGPLTAMHAEIVEEALARAEAHDAAAALVDLDTPGGRVDLTREIVQAMLTAEVPVLVHVTPSGAQAGSAGTFITYAAHVAAMSSGTTIGAATPVDIEGGEVSDKILEDSVSYAEALAEERDRDLEFIVDAVREGRAERASVALELGAVDLLAGDTDELLAEVDGREVTLDSGRTVTLATAEAPVVDVEASAVQRALSAIATPDIAFLLITVGTLGVIYELANPGLGIGGVLGAIMLILAFASLAVLPTSAAGLALLVLAIGLLVGELFVPGVGVLAAGGAVSLLFAGLLLFDGATGLGVSWTVLFPTVVIAGLGALGIGVLAARQRNRPATSGAEALIGARGEVRRVDGRRLQVWVDGSLWDAGTQSGATLAPGDEVTVVDRDGLRLTVEPEEQTWTSTP